MHIWISFIYKLNIKSYNAGSHLGYDDHANLLCIVPILVYVPLKRVHEYDDQCDQCVLQSTK